MEFVKEPLATSVTIIGGGGARAVNRFPKVRELAWVTDVGHGVSLPKGLVFFSFASYCGSVKRIG